MPGIGPDGSPVRKDKVESRAAEAFLQSETRCFHFRCSHHREHARGFGADAVLRLYGAGSGY